LTASPDTEIRAVQTRFAVERRLNERLDHERVVRAGGDGNVGPIEQREDAQRVARRVGEDRVAADRRDAADLERGRGAGEQDRQGVVVARVAVEHDRPRAIRRRRAGELRERATLLIGSGRHS
jgi:hypothetical protein